MFTLMLLKLFNLTFNMLAKSIYIYRVLFEFVFLRFSKLFIKSLKLILDSSYLCTKLIHKI
jgi:hypothetical protein